MRANAEKRCGVQNEGRCDGRKVDDDEAWSTVCWGG